MQITPIKLSVLVPPQDDLLSKIKRSKLRLKDGDVVAVSSKVVSIHEGRCTETSSITKDALAKREAQMYVPRGKDKKFKTLFTITRGVLLGVAGIDESNGNGYFVLYPKDPMQSAKKLLAWFKKEYGVKRLGVIITDSHSTPLRRGAIGFCLAWAGFEPHFDYRGNKDIFGREMKLEQANLADALAAGAVVVMGEGNEQTPLAVIRSAPEKVWHSRHSTKLGYRSFVVPMEEDLFAPFLTKVKWKKGGKN